MAMQNKGSKRFMLDNDKTAIFIAVSISSAIVVAGLMFSKSLWSQGAYYSKVASQKEIAVKQLEDNKEAVDALKASYESFRNQDPNLIGGSRDGTGERDGDNAKIILDALPNKYDFPGLTSSIERLLAGYSIKSITGFDDTITQKTASPGTTVEIPFSVGITTNYESLKQLIDTFEKSIRPLHFTRIELRGNNSSLQTEMDLKTYYQPEKGLDIKVEEVL